MKIILFHTYNQGYLSSFFHELSKKLVDEGNEVISFSWKRSVSERVIDGVRVIIKEKKGYINNYYNVYNILKKEKPEVVLSNFSYVNPALLFGKIFGIKKNMVWFHSLHNQMNPTKTQVFIKKYFLKLADIVIANSFLTKQELEYIYKVKHNKIRTFPFWTNILETNAVGSTKKIIKDELVLNIGCPGRLTPHKNQRIIIEALSKLNSCGYNKFHLFIAGSGESKDKLEKNVQEYALEDKVTFVDYLSPSEMVSYYNEMDVIILPSLDEAFGLVFIEAIALGKPVIVSNKFGALTFIDQSKFQLEEIMFKPNSSDDLIQKLKPYFNSSTMPSSFFKNLYDTTFDKNKIYEELKQLFIIS